MSNMHEFLKPRSLFGWIIIGLALIMLFENFGIGVFSKVLSNWPIGLVLIGVAMLYSTNRNNNSKTPYILIGIGFICFLSMNQLFHFKFNRILFPILLLSLGVYLLKPKLFKSKNNNEINTDNMNQDNSIDAFSILGGVVFNTASKNLNGGNVISILGGADVDLRDADMESDFIEVNVLSLMGGIEIKVPPHWQVSAKAIPILGGVSNETTCLADRLQMPKKILLVKGVAIMGGIEVKN